MTPGAAVFMVLSWGFVLGLTVWSFGRILRHEGRRGGDDLRKAEAPASQEQELTS